MKIVTVIGARPQFIKAAAVCHHLQKRHGITEILVHTGQHFETNMSDVFFHELGIPKPAHHLDIHGLSHGAMTGRMLEQLETVFAKENPDAVMVYGDTNSTLAGALAAAKMHIPVAHVEAGLRSFNRRMPEELNRVLTDNLSEILFAPTTVAVEQLKKENVSHERIVWTGDVMLDANLLFQPLAKKRNDLPAGLPEKNYVLMTVHRQENTDDDTRLGAIVKAVNALAAHHAVIFPLHPRTRKKLAAMDLHLNAKVHVLDPVSYLAMLRLESGASVIVTDSGGVQKEAYFNRVPCVTVRTETEWTELVSTGWNRLADPANKDEIYAAVNAAMGSHGQHGDLYGDGRASERIADALLDM